MVNLFGRKTTIHEDGKALIRGNNAVTVIQQANSTQLKFPETATAIMEF